MDPNSQPEGSSSKQPTVPVEVVGQQPPKRARRPIGVLGSLLIVFLLLGLGASVILNIGFLLDGTSFSSKKKVREEFVSHKRYGEHKVAIISLEGMIYDEEGGFVKRQIEQVAEDEDVKAVVLRVNSPGGTITGSDYLHHHLRELREKRRIPIVVSMGSLAASGGYYVAMAAGDTPDSIFAERTTWTGSIGVIIPHYDLSTLLGEKLGIEDDAVTSHPLKSMGSFAKPMTEEERRIYQALVDEGFGHFKDIVKAGRPKFKKDPKALDELATGQIYTAKQALKNGLIDKIGFIEDAIQRAIELAGVDKDDVRVVKYRREPTMADILLGVRASDRGLDLATVLDMTVPRAYYLSTRVPPLVQSGN